ncbi:hypothetical protein COT72_01880 [archaeon CG10_big_fil_rev_8_21_14_0_10_43_11]|nr:MAG: hypothetical protein COT72_01880 [archaeon CG10_big_fil_rev_8_21_14_0_10_43_11]
MNKQVILLLGFFGMGVVLLVLFNSFFFISSEYSRYSDAQLVKRFPLQINTSPTEFYPLEETSPVLNASLTWFLSINQSDMSTPWVLKNILESCTYPSLVKKARELYAYTIRSLFEPSYEILIYDQSVRANNVSALTFVSRALLCNTNESYFSKDYAQALDAHQNSGGEYVSDAYFKAHFVLALMFAKERGCISDEFATALIEKNAAELAAQNNENAFVDDAFVEIAAVIAYAQPDLYDDIWTQKIVDAQDSFGFWSGIETSRYPNTHTSSLALWALVMRNGCDGW